MSTLAKDSVAAVLATLCLSGLVVRTNAEEITSATAPEVAQQAASQDEDKWVFNSPLYLWASGMSGTATVNGRRVSYDLSFTDIYDHLDVGFMAYFELAKPQYGFYVQPNYDALSADGGSGGIKAQLETQLWIVEFGGFYRIWNSASDRPANLYAVVGGRYWNIHNNLTVKDPILGKQTGADTAWLCDPIVGLRFTEYLTKKVHVWVQGDIGGFGIAENTSRFSWQVMPLIGYDFTMPVIKKPSTVFAGWRWLNVQHLQSTSSGKTSIDLTMSGVIVGVNVQLF
jgi:hypothetical protein